MLRPCLYFAAGVILALLSVAAFGSFKTPIEPYHIYGTSLYEVSPYTVPAPIVQNISKSLPRHIKKPIEPSPAEVRCMSENIYYEARGEPTKGKLAVAFVTLNRARERHQSICRVVHASTKIEGKIFCQFTWVCSKHKAKLVRKTYWKCVWLARRVLEHRLKDFTHGANYFHDKTVSPAWSWYRRPVLVIGALKFYRIG